MTSPQDEAFTTPIGTAGWEPTPAPTGTTTTTSQAPVAGPSGARRARLRLIHLEPWSVMKTTFLLSVALGVVTVVAVAIVWTVLGAAGLWTSINTIVQDTIGDTNGTPFEIQRYLGTSRVVGFSMIVAVVDIVLLTAIATVGAFLYNIAASLLGGVEVTVAEDH